VAVQKQPWTKIASRARNRHVGLARQIGAMEAIAGGERAQHRAHRHFRPVSRDFTRA